VGTTADSFLYANGTTNTIRPLLRGKKDAEEKPQEDIGKDPRYLATTGSLKLTAAEQRIDIEVAPTFLTERGLLCTIKVGLYGRSSVYVWLSGRIPEVSNWSTRGDDT
jgi:hypothetical protein